MHLKIEENVDLKKYNSWKVGGLADYFCMPTSLEEMVEAEDFALQKNIPIRVLGSGSNVLIPDEGLRGLVICTKRFKGLKKQIVDGKLQIETTSGEAKFSLMKAFASENLPPAIFLSGLPGDIGGGLVMNAGISEKILPRDFSEITDWIEVLHQGNVIRYESKDLNWSYRHMEGWRPGIIIGAGFSWKMSDADSQIKEKAQNFSKTRWERQPLDLPSCGSTFVNPPGTSAGFLIESAGLKGFTIGGAQVSPKHANFLVNLGSATANDLLELIRHVQKVVKEKSGIELKTEVQFL